MKKKYIQPEILALDFEKYCSKGDVGLYKTSEKTDHYDAKERSESVNPIWDNMDASFEDKW